MRVWGVADELGATCGFCGDRIAAGAPMQRIDLQADRLPDRRRLRCAAHAEGALDDAAVAEARARLTCPVGERHAATPVPRRSTTHFHKPARRLVPASEIAASLFDPKALAAHDHD